MTDGKYVCIRCKSAGAKSLIPYKIIEDRDGMSVKFKGQLCERCYKELFESAPMTKNTGKNDESNQN